MHDEYTGESWGPNYSCSECGVSKVWIGPDGLCGKCREEIDEREALVSDLQLIADRNARLYRGINQTRERWISGAGNLKMSKEEK